MKDDASLRVSFAESSHPLSSDADSKRFDKNMTLQDISQEQQNRMRDEFLKQRKQGR